MGLTIHWTIKLEDDRHPARVLERLRRAANALPLKSLDARVTSLEGAACGDRSIACTMARGMRVDDSTYVSVPPSALHYFHSHPGPGCESALFFLAKYPKSVEFDGRRRRVPDAGMWSSSSWCKT